MPKGVPGLPGLGGGPKMPGLPGIGGFPFGKKK
jgi:signal recognition particle subunit SRP54